MRPLAFTFYLGPSLAPTAAAIARELGARIGVAVAFDAAATDAERLAQLERGDPGVAWLCGLATVERQDAGTLDAGVAAAPVFPGETAPVYRSLIVLRAGLEATSLDELEGRTLAINERASWSGHHALRAHLALAGLGTPLFGRVFVTGGHAASIDALLAGTADVAAIDHTAWTARSAADPRTAGLRILEPTRDWPAPPFSVSRSLDPGIRRAIAETLPTLHAPGLTRIVAAADDDYAPLRAGLALSRSLAW